jgi:hypothetical protein
MSQNSDLIAATKASAVRDCMRRQGMLPAGGGVESLHQTNASTLWQK